MYFSNVKVLNVFIHDDHIQCVHDVHPCNFLWNPEKRNIVSVTGLDQVRRHGVQEPTNLDAYTGTVGEGSGFQIWLDQIVFFHENITGGNNEFPAPGPIETIRRIQHGDTLYVFVQAFMTRDKFKSFEKIFLEHFAYRYSHFTPAF
jgi:hypothetical protein